jgi:hypothetical protein
MTGPLPVDGLGLDFRDIVGDDRAAKIAQYALSLKILAAVEGQELDEEQRAKIKADLTAAKTKLDRSQKSTLDALKK